MKDLTMTFSQREDGTLHVLFQSEDAQFAVEAPQINGDVQNDRMVICNLFRNLERIFHEYFFPETALKWESKKLPTGETIHTPPQ